MKSLEQLNLYRTRVTNAGLEALKELKSLREVDVRYSRATQAGVNTLQKSLPDTRFIFVGTAPRIESERLQRRGASLSAWVRSQGGKVVVERGRVSRFRSPPVRSPMPIWRSWPDCPGFGSWI